VKIAPFSSIEKRPKSDVCVVAFASTESGDPEPLFDDEQLLRVCKPLLAAKDFSGKLGEMAAVYPSPVSESKVVLLGLGERSAIHLEQIRQAFAQLSRSVLAKESVSLITPVLEQLSSALVLEAILEGVYWGAYRFDRYRTKKKPFHLKQVALLCDEPALFIELEHKVRAYMEGVALTRDLVNSNAKDITPEGFAQAAQAIEGGRLRVEVHGKDWIEREQMNLLLAVSSGAHVEPRFVVVEWKGAPESQEVTALVGKGITFDTGGLNIKVGDFMKDMKGDMGGAAAVLGVMKAIAELDLAVNVTAAIPLCENGVDAASYKQGDVYVSRKGISVEISNTDAEGRLILADGLDYARDVLKASRIIDIATLTGAAEVAVGKDFTALFSNTEALSYELIQAGKRSGDLMWPLPLHDGYAKLLESSIADCKTLGGRAGGSSIAASFLKQFVDDTPWVHLDIAGSSDVKKPGRYYFEEGATGAPVRALVNFFEKLSREQ